MIEMIRAKFSPKNPDKYSSGLINSQEVICNWKLAFEIAGVKFYATADRRFPTTDAFPETDLEEVTHEKR